MIWNITYVSVQKRQIALQIYAMCSTLDLSLYIVRMKRNQHGGKYNIYYICDRNMNDILYTFYFQNWAYVTFVISKKL